MLDTRRLTKADESSWAMTLTSKDENRCFIFGLIGDFVCKNGRVERGRHAAAPPNTSQTMTSPKIGPPLLNYFDFFDDRLTDSFCSSGPSVLSPATTKGIPQSIRSLVVTLEMLPPYNAHNSFLPDAHLLDHYALLQTLS
jgi:hypothetical protein